MSFQEKIQYTITNAKFIEDENGADGRGDRHVQFDINYTLTDWIVTEPVKIFIQFKSGNTSLKLVQKEIYFPTRVGNLRFGDESINRNDWQTDTDGSSWLWTDTISIEVFIWSMNDIPLSEKKKITLRVQKPEIIIPTTTPEQVNIFPNTNWVTSAFSTETKYEDNDLMGTAFAMKTDSFSDTYNSKVLTLFVIVKEGNTTIDVMQFPFTFGNTNQFSVGLNKVFTSEKITLTILVLDSDNRPYSEPTILELQNAPSIVIPEPVEIPQVTAPQPEPVSIATPSVETTEPEKPILTDRMVNQDIGTFEIIDGRVIGTVTYGITSEFNPYYYNKPISSFVQISTESNIDLVVKENKLNFTQNDRTEIININETAGNFTKLIVEFFVLKDLQDVRPLSSPKRITIKEGIPSTVNPPAIEPHHDSLLGAVKGIFIGTLALSLLASRGK